MSKSGTLRTIIVRGLFGSPISRSLAINLDQHAPTVLTGANGTGKSTILRLISAVSGGDISALAKAPLKQFILEFDAIPPYIFNRQGEDRFSLTWGEHSNSFTHDSKQMRDFPSWALEALEDSDFSMSVPERLERAAVAEGVSLRERHEILMAINDDDFRPNVYEAPPWQQELSEQFPALYVTDQRLVVEKRRARIGQGRRYREVGQTFRLAVEAATADLAQQMKQLDSAYARASLINDRKFPQQVIRAMNQAHPVELKALEKLVANVDDRRAVLREVGLLETDDSFLPELRPQDFSNEQVRPVISLFLETTLKKLDVFGELELKLSSFKSFLDERFEPKSVVMSRQGLRFSLPSGESIRPSQLSSGEQQMFVLAYEILFRAQRGTLLLVDEPEISLHVRWQATLIEHLVEMGRASQLQFLLATHSPILLGSHPELERPLDEVID